MSDESQDLSAWIRPTEAAKLIGTSRTSMYRWLERLAREGVRIVNTGPHTTLIERTSLEAWLKQRELHPGPAQPPERRGRKPSGWWERIRKKKTDDNGGSNE